MSQKIQAANEEDLERLRRILRKVKDRDTDFVKRRLEKGKKPVRVLDLACGSCHEAGVIGDLAAEMQGDPQAEVSLTGMDVRAREIAEAAAKFGKVRAAGEKGGKREFEFLVGDATKLDEAKELGGNYDLVFLRHQNYWNGARDWHEIFDKALEKLDEDGRLVITSYFDKEHALALETIQKLGGELIATEANPESRALATPGKSVDRHVAMFRKKTD